jgi:hypothetical protein
MRWMLHIGGSPPALDVVVGGFFPCDAQLPQGPEDLRHDVGRVGAHLGRKGFGVIEEVAEASERFSMEAGIQQQ